MCNHICDHKKVTEKDEIVLENIFRLQEEDLEVAGLSVADLTQTTTTTTTTTTSTTTTPKGYYPGIVGWFAKLHWRHKEDDIKKIQELLHISFVINHRQIKACEKILFFCSPCSFFSLTLFNFFADPVQLERNCRLCTSLRRKAWVEWHITQVMVLQIKKLKSTVTILSLTHKRDSMWGYLGNMYSCEFQLIHWRLSTAKWCTQCKSFWKWVHYDEKAVV